MPTIREGGQASKVSMKIWDKWEGVINCWAILRTDEVVQVAVSRGSRRVISMSSSNDCERNTNCRCSESVL